MYVDISTFWDDVAPIVQKGNPFLLYSRKSKYLHQGAKELEQAKARSVEGILTRKKNFSGTITRSRFRKKDFQKL